MKDVMLDFETLGNKTNKCIVQIGACYFDRITGEIGETFKVNVDAISHENLGAKLDAKTVYWWLSQSKEAINSIIQEPRVGILEAFISLNNFLKSAKCIWSHSTFDFVLLEENMVNLNIERSYSYKASMDIRTLVNISKITMDKELRLGIHHDALDDCKFQVLYCVKALNNIINMKSINKILPKED